MNGRRVTIFLVLLLCFNYAYAQEQMDCYGPGSIAGAVLGTLIVTLILLVVLYYGYKKVWKPRQEKHLILETDAEKGDSYAFDNPGFKDAGLTPIGKALDKNGSKLDSGKHKWSQWSPLGAFVSTKNEKKKTVDDSNIDDGEVKFVTLRSHDFTGLGFNIYGNMRDGIFIKDVLHRGPASESGKLNQGDKINSLKINFEHMVYEDALAILSYASPYEVEIEAKSGVKSQGPNNSQGAKLKHPLYRSSSSSDLIKIGKSARSRLFQDSMDNSVATDYSTLQLSSNNTSLERSRKSPKSDANSLTKPERNKKPQPPTSKPLSPEQLKSQLEQSLAQKIINPNDIPVNDKKITKEPKKTEVETQNTENPEKTNRFSKFGIRVLPMEMKQENVQPSRSPKSAELSQNDNNINLEKKMEGVDSGIDEVDKTKPKDEVDKTKIKDEAPPIKKREKPNKQNENMIRSIPDVAIKVTNNFDRENNLNTSGIKRDKAGIPQEIPDHMMNAAVAARKNRKSNDSIDKLEPEESESIKSPKKLKGKAPAPPEVTKIENKTEMSEKINNVDVPFNATENLDKITPMEDKIENEEDANKNLNKTDDSITERKTKTEKTVEDGKEYCSDSDMETDNQSSVNTIELNSSDITIHHSETDPDIKGRKTASTGDLSKIHKTRKTSTGTLERAQSLDITDSGIPTLTKKRKASKDDSEPKLSDSDDSIYEKSVLKNKEPRLSLALDGLDTFQRNRLKKSSEWGNLEDAIMTLDKVEVDVPTDTKIEFKESKSPITFNFGTKNIEFGSSITKINDEPTSIPESDYSMNLGVTDYLVLTEDINNSLNNAETEDIKIVKVKNQIWPPFEEKNESKSEEEIIIENNLDIEEPKINNIESKSNNVEIKEINLPEPTTIDIKTNVEVKTVWPVFEPNTENEEVIHVNTEKVDTHVIETKIKNNERTSPVEFKYTTEPVNITTTKINSSEPSFSLKAQFQEKLNEKLKTDPENKETVTLLPANKTQENSIFHPGKSSQNFIFAEKYASNNDNDGLYSFSSKLYDTNVSDDIKVSRHSLGSLERPKSDVLKSVNKLKMQSLISSDQGGVSNITITENKQNYENGLQDTEPKETKSETTYDMSTASELYTTAIDSSSIDNKSNVDVSLNQMNDIKNITITETSSFDSNLLTDSPSSLTIDTSSDGPDSIKSHTLTYVTEIQVSTPTNGTKKNVSEIEVNANVKAIPEVKKEEEVLKRLPEMKFTTSSYESKPPEKRMSQIELLRSNFEKSPPKNKSTDLSPSKSRIPVLSSKIDVKSSPERREMRFGENDEEKEIVEIMSSAIHSTPLAISNQRYQNKIPPRNVTVTSIRTSSKIPSGSHISSFTNKPPVPARPTDHSEAHESRSSNGNSESFKQWVFNPGETSVTSIVVENKEHQK